MGVSSSLTGVIGRRTQYQQVDIAQLVLEVATTGNHDNTDSNEDLNATVFPKVNYQCVCMFVCVCTYIYCVCTYVRTYVQDVLLEDDTLLPHIKVTDPLHQATPTQLTSLQQAVVLAQWCVWRKWEEFVIDNKHDHITLLLQCVSPEDQPYTRPY